MTWLPEDFVHPVQVPLPSGDHHLRPIRAADTSLDHPAVMGSRERLWSIFGPAWSWPAATMTYEENRIDLLRHEREIAAQEKALDALVPEWIAADWPFERPRFLGRDITWQNWLAPADHP